MTNKESKIKKLFQIVIPKSCPQCGERSLEKTKKGINCKNCGVLIQTQIENKKWFYSSQDKSVKLNLKKALINKQRKIRDRLIEIRDIRKIL